MWHITIKNNNNFPFMEMHFYQIIHKSFISTIFFFKSFIDDIILTLLSATNQLQSLKNFMSTIKFTVKFNFEHSNQVFFQFKYCTI